MSNKEKNKEPYLLQDEKLSEYETENTTIKIFHPKKDKPEEISNAISKSKNPEEDVTYNEDGTISVTEDDITEYKKENRTIHDFNVKISGPDTEDFLEFLKADIEVADASLGSKKELKVTEENYDPSLNNKGQILTNESFKKMVNNFNKINLSESDIINILEETQNPTMTKSELLETINNNLISEANMNDNVRQKFESGDNDYNDILGQELTNQLAQEAFQEIADDIRRKTGRQNVTLNDVQNLLGTSLMAAAKEEYRIGTENLERKAVDMIRKQYNIPADAVEFDAKIVGLPPQMLVGGDMSPQQMEQLSNQAGIKVGKINREGLKMSKGDKQPPQGVPRLFPGGIL